MNLPSTAAVAILLALVVPPMALLAVQVYRFLKGWIRGYSVREVADRPLGLSQHGRSGTPTKVCPGCGQIIPLAAGECRYCDLRFDSAPRHRPAREPRRWPRPALDLSGDPSAYEPPERRGGALAGDRGNSEAPL